MVFELKNGGRNELWARMEPQIARLLSKFGVKPIQAKTIDQMVGGALIEKMAQGAEMSLDRLAGVKMSSTPTVRSTRTAKLPTRLWPFPFPGGIKGAHIHFQGDVYLLNAAQWKQFSAQVMKDIEARISKANMVSFDQLMAMDEATASLM